MDSGKIEVHYHGPVIMNGYIEYNQDRVDIWGSTIQDAYNTGGIPDIHSTSMSPGDLNAYTAPLINADARPPVIPSNIRPASEPRNMSTVGREFHLTAAQPPWLGGASNDESEPVAPTYFPSKSPVFCNPAGGGVSIHNRAPEWEQHGTIRSPTFPLAVPSLSSSLPTCTCPTYEGNVTHPAYPGVVSRTVPCPRFPTEEVSAPCHQSRPWPQTTMSLDFASCFMPGPPLQDNARLESTPCSNSHGGHLRSAAAAACPPSFPVPRHHPPYQHP